MKKAEKGASVNKGVGDFAIWFVAEGRETARRSSQQRDPRKKKKTEMTLLRVLSLSLSLSNNGVWVLGEVFGLRGRLWGGLVSSSAKHFE